MEPLTLSIFGSLKKTVFLGIHSTNSHQKRLLANDELQENRDLCRIGRH